MDPRRRRRGDGRHLRPCAGSAGRHRLRRGARGREDPDQGAGGRGGRIGQGRQRRLFAGRRRGDRGQWRDRRRPRADQPRPGRRGLVLQAEAQRSGRAGRADERIRLSRMGEDALSDHIASTSQWDAADYAAHGGFVPALGQAALELLDPQPGEHILDVGCGDGTLTLKIKEMGADVVGIDNSLSMVAAAKAKGLDARLMDAAQLKFGEAFDAAFSNATLHWVLDKERAARAIWFALKNGGRFAGEMGGHKNLSKLRRALDEVLVERGYGPPTYAANWYSTPDEFIAVYEQAGFKDV